MQLTRENGEYAFIFHGKPQSVGYPQQQQWFVAKQEAITAAQEMGMIVREDGSVIGQA